MMGELGSSGCINKQPPLKAFLMIEIIKTFIRGLIQLKRSDSIYINTESSLSYSVVIRLPVWSNSIVITHLLL